ncbi:MAG: Lytic transglycosylase catalytic, partial [Parcubacteria group bacterium GW2011_GWA2_50_10b]
ENGGSDTAVSSAGALGVFQLMPGTARSLGLTVNKKVDERKIPEKNIAAGMKYLKGNFERFGDWGLATWAYHAGEGNVSKAIKIYAKAKDNITLAGVKDPKAMRDYVEKHDITVHKLLSDPSVKKFTQKLKDDSQGYPYKVVATAALFREAK